MNFQLQLYECTYCSPLFPCYIETSFLFSQTRIYWPVGAWPGPPTFSASKLKRLSRESNPVSPALQANTLCKEPFTRRSSLLVLLQLPPMPRCRKLLIGDRGWVWLVCGYNWSDTWREQCALTSVACEGAERSNLRTEWELHHVGVTTM